MDKQVSIKKFFDHYYKRKNCRTKFEEKDHSEVSQPGNKSNDSDPGSKSINVKNSRFHKLISKNNVTSNYKKRKFKESNFSAIGGKITGKKSQLNTKQKENKGLLSCFKRNSSEDDLITKTNKIPVSVKKQDSNTGGNYVDKEEIPCAKLAQSHSLETEPPRRHSHNSVIELMSRDGTLKLYSATTLTPLSSSGIKDEERIQTHLSLSLFRPEMFPRSSSSEGPDDVFEVTDETSTSLALNLQNLRIKHSNDSSVNCVPRIPPKKNSLVTSDKESEYLIKESISKDNSLNLMSDKANKEIQTYPPKRIKEKLDSVATHYPRLETQNVIYDKINPYNHPSQLNYEETYQIPSNIPLKSTARQEKVYCSSSVHSCNSVTSYISPGVPPVKKWILQLYFNSLVADNESYHGNLNNNYAEEYKIEDSSPPVPYTQQNYSKIFHQTALEGQHSREPFTRISSETNSNSVSQKYQSDFPTVQSRKCSLTMKSENGCFAKSKLESKPRKYQAMNKNKSKKSTGYYVEKETNLNCTRLMSAPTTGKSQKRTRCPFREKYLNPKPAIFSQDNTYTHYPFIDGPLARDIGKMGPINNVTQNYRFVY